MRTKSGLDRGWGRLSEDESGLDIVAELQALGHDVLGVSIRYASGPGISTTDYLQVRVKSKRGSK